MDATHLKVWLPFDESTTLDRCGNSWTAYNNPSISDGALSLVGGNPYLSLNDDLPLGGRDFTVSGEFLMNSSTEKWARIFCVFIDTETEANAIRVARNDTSDQLNVCALNVSQRCPVTMGTAYHFELDYHHSSGTVDFFLGGVKQLTLSVTIPRINFTHCWLGRSNFSADGYFNGTLDNFMVFDGVALHSENFTPPTAAGYDAITSWTVTVNADVEVLIANRDPSSNYWRYENPGSGDYILYHDNITTENVGFDQSVTGMAFWGGDRNDMVGIPTGCKELWIRLDLWVHSRLEGTNYDTDFGFGCMTTNPDLSLAGYRIWSWLTPTVVGHTLCINKNMYFTLRTGSRNSILVYLKSGKTDGEICGTVGSSTRRYIGNVNAGDDFGNVFFWSTTNSGMFSNIVVSNAPLSLEDGWHREPAAVEFNIKAVDLCVRKNGRTYEIPFSTTNSAPVNSVIARVGGKTVYNPLVATTDENASALKVRYNGEDRALSASFN